jgi:hypothetical protein
MGPACALPGLNFAETLPDQDSCKSGEPSPKITALRVTDLLKRRATRSWLSRTLELPPFVRRMLITSIMRLDSSPRTDPSGEYK